MFIPISFFKTFQYISIINSRFIIQTKIKVLPITKAFCQHFSGLVDLIIRCPFQPVQTL
jgi:hypothetical protein